MPAETNETVVNGNAPLVNGHKPIEQTIVRHSLPNIAISYPSQSLRFLEKLGDEELPCIQARHGSTNPTPARLKLNIVIIGAGLGGLALAIALVRRGHSVRVLEQAPKLGEVSWTTHSIERS